MRHPCPICGAAPSQREQLRASVELCNGCNLVIEMDEAGHLVQWWITQRPRRA